MPPRERYASEGPVDFGDAELLALVLGTGAGGCSALQIATCLLERFGGLSGVAARQPHELRTVPGVGFERAVRLHAALEAGRRALHRDLGVAPVTSAMEAWELLEPGLRGRPHEELHALYLDKRRRPLARRRLTRGSAGYTVVDPKQVYRVAVGVGAAAVILAHNHPSGDPQPSREDRRVTEQVAKAGRVLGIPLLDHLVIGDRSFRSLADLGWCPREGLEDKEPPCCLP